VKEVEQNICDDLCEIIYDYVWSAKDYVAQLPKLPFIADQRSERSINDELRKQGSSLYVLPLCYKYVTYRNHSTAYWHLKFCPTPWHPNMIDSFSGIGIVGLKANPKSCMDRYLGRVVD
jgi:hypothetical protein